MLWRSRRWRFLLNLIDHLPTNSAFGEAIAQDDELAEQREPAASRGPSISEWSTDVALLSDLVDVALLIRTEMWTLAGQKKTPPYRPMPRPSTAAERAVAAARARNRDDLQRLLFGGG